MRADVVGRAMRLIADGVVDRDGVQGLAARLGYSERHLHRLLRAEVGAGPLALARAQRAQTARVLVETTELPFSQVAFGAGFASIRQFNDTVREVFAATPTELRQAARRRGGPRTAAGVTGAAGVVALRLPVRQPFDGDALLAFLGRRAVAGIEERAGDTYRRTLRLPHGPAVVELAPRPDHVACRLRLTDLRDLTQAVQRSRRLLDLDADPVAVGAVLGADPLLAPLVAKAPGLRSPGHVDGAELALRAVLGQQVSLGAASTHTARLVAAAGTPLPAPDGGLTHLFPEPAAVAELDDARPRHARPTAADDPRARRPPGRRHHHDRPRDRPGGAGAAAHRARRRRAVDGGATSRCAASAIRTSSWPATSASAAPSSSSASPATPGALRRGADSWRPWRSYALHHLWASLS